MVKDNEMRIIYIDIDSLRADHLGCYGYSRPITPVIDSIAASGAVFRNCHTSDAPCLPSRAALFSGRFGINNGITCHDGPASQMRYAGQGHTHDSTRPMWMRFLQTAGWETISFSGFGQRHLAWWYFAGFTQGFGNQLPGDLETADDVNARLIPWLKQNGTTDNWFMHVNYWDVHHPYRASQAYYDRVSQYPAPLHPTAADIAYDVQHYYGPRTARDWWLDEPDCRNPNTPPTRLMPQGNIVDYDSFLGFLNGADAGLAYVDDKIAEILLTLDELGIREETAIIISSDHGESVGELGMYFEHGNACEGTTHVPLIIHWPGVTRGSTHDALIYQLDLPPTILDLLGMEIPEGWDGTSFSTAMNDKEFPGHSHLVMGTGIYSFQRAVRTSKYRLIRTIHPGLYPYEPLYLFDMEHDPLQRHNIAEQNPEIVAQLDHLLLEWLWCHTTGASGVRDPFQEQLAAGFDPDLYCPRKTVEARLLNLGRQDQVADLRMRRDRRAALQFDTPRSSWKFLD